MIDKRNNDKKCNENNKQKGRKSKQIGLPKAPPRDFSCLLGPRQLPKVDAYGFSSSILPKGILPDNNSVTKFEKISISSVSSSSEKKGMTPDAYINIAGSAYTQELYAIFQYDKSTKDMLGEVTAKTSQMTFMYNFLKFLKDYDFSSFQHYLKMQQKKYSETKIENIDPRDLHAAIDLLFDEKLNGACILQCNSDYTYNENHIELQKDMQKFITDIYEKLADNYYVKQWESRDIVEYLTCVMCYLQDLKVPDVMNQQVEKYCSDKEISHIETYFEWDILCNNVIFSVINKLIADNPKEKINQLYDASVDFMSGDDLLRGDDKDMRKNVQYHAKMISMLILSVKNYVYLDETVKKFKETEWYKNFRFSSIDSTPVKGMGNIILKVRDKNNNKFIIHYDEFGQCISFMIEIPELSEDEVFCACIDSGIKIPSNSAIFRSSRGFCVNQDDNVYFNFDLYINKPTERVAEAVSLSKVLKEKGLIVLKNINCVCKGLLERERNHEMLSIEVDEMTDTISLSLDKRSAMTYGDLVLYSLEYDKRAEEEFWQAVQKNDSDIVCHELSPLKRFGYHSLQIEEEKTIDSNQDLEPQKTDSEIEREYRDKILKYLRCGGSRDLLSYEETIEFLSRLGSLIITENGGKGSHYKLTLADNNNGFATVSKSRRVQGCYVKEVCDTIESLQISYKEAYEKAVEPFM